MRKLETLRLDTCTHLRDVVTQKRAFLRDVTRYVLDMSEDAPHAKENERERNSEHNHDECGYDEEDIHLEEVVHSGRAAIVRQNGYHARFFISHARRQPRQAFR